MNEYKETWKDIINPQYPELYNYQNMFKIWINQSYIRREEINKIQDPFSSENDPNCKLDQLMFRSNESNKQKFINLMAYLNRYLHNHQMSGYYVNNKNYDSTSFLNHLKNTFEEDQNPKEINVDELAKKLEGKIKGGSDTKALEEKVKRIEQFSAGIMDKINVLAELVDQKSDERITAYLIAIMNKLGITEQCPICFKAELLISLHEVKEGSSEHKVCEACKNQLTDKKVPKRLQRCPICRVNLAGVANDVFPREEHGLDEVPERPRLERSLSRASMVANMGDHS